MSDQIVRMPPPTRSDSLAVGSIIGIVLHRSTASLPMHIYIDESGTFLRAADKPGVSLVGALVIPDHRLAKVERKYRSMRERLPKERGEVKGRLMSEQQVWQVTDLLRRNEALLEIVAIDLNMHTDEGIAVHQAQQAEGLTRYVTEQHHPNLRLQVAALRQRLEAMPPQLYVQAVAMSELIWETLCNATMYFSQRQPKELGMFRWRIDAKDKNGITNWEDWWRSVVKPSLQSKSIRKPMPQLVEGDYSHWEGLTEAIPGWLPRANDKVTDGIKLGPVLTKDLRFSSSPDPGLELVDIVVNAVRRALIGHLREEGWRDIPTLMIHREGHYIHLVALHDAQGTFSPSFIYALNHFRHGGRNVLAPRFAD